MKLLGVEIWRTDRETVRAWVQGCLEGDALARLTFANAHTLNLHHRQTTADHRSASEDWLRGFVVLPDGVGVDLAARMRGGSLENLNGTDFVPWLLANPPRPLSVFLYGDTAATNAAAVDHVRSTYPQVTVAGAIDGFVDEADAIAEILAAPPFDILLVATGQPKQEKFLRGYGDKLNGHAHLGIGVGALFAFMAGRVVRAPKLVRMLRCEWIWRLAQEPRRLFSRYVVGNVTFLWRAARSARTERHDPADG
jgi:exopolysaccharide biosynthesis WecB/TagA/CpsF family protein